MGVASLLSQALPIISTSAIYAYLLPFLKQYSRLSPTPLQLAEDLEQLKVLEHGFIIKTIFVEKPSIEVNVPEDIQKVERFLCEQSSSS